MTDGLAKDRWLFWLCIALSVALHGGLAAYLLWSETTKFGAVETPSEAISVNLVSSDILDAAEQSLATEAAAAPSAPSSAVPPPEPDSPPKTEAEPEVTAEDKPPEEAERERVAEAASQRAKEAELEQQKTEQLARDETRARAEEAERQRVAEAASQRAKEAELAQQKAEQLARVEEAERQRAAEAASQRAKEAELEQQKAEQRKREHAEDEARQEREEARDAQRRRQIEQRDKAQKQPAKPRNQAPASAGASGSRGAQASKGRISASQGSVRNYGGTVNAWIARNKPPSTGVIGTVVIRLAISPSGNLISARVASSSGNPNLDRSALAAVQRSSPFPTPPSGAKAASLVFTYAFRFTR